MASNNVVAKNLLKNKVVLFSIIGFFLVALIFSLQKVYAYYHKEITSDLLANKVGDFDMGDGNVNMMIYRENDEGKFVKVYAIPSAYYTLNQELTSCSIPCNDGLGNCEYEYDNVNNTISITSNQKITCKFYFEKEVESDINIYVLLEDDSADDTYILNSKKYKISNILPAYGYVYSENYRCDGDAELIFNSETKKFSLLTGTKNNCYVYFDKVGQSDITVNTFVQSEFGSDVYNAVESIPSNKIYVLNEDKSSCTAVNSDGENGIVTYEDGYINIVASEPQSCIVYLDLESN